MTLLLAVLVAWLFAVGTYLLLQRALTRIVLGLGLLGHGAVLLLITVGGRAGTRRWWAREMTGWASPPSPRPSP